MASVTTLLDIAQLISFDYGPSNGSDPTIRTLVEVVDCIGDQIHHDKDRELALLAAILLRRVRATRKAALQADPKWAQDLSSGLEMGVSQLLNEVLNEGGPASYVYEGLDLVVSQLRALELVEAYMS